VRPIKASTVKEAAEKSLGFGHFFRYFYKAQFRAGFA
jgi:hypothetical protein